MRVLYAASPPTPMPSAPLSQTSVGLCVNIPNPVTQSTMALLTLQYEVQSLTALASIRYFLADKSQPYGTIASSRLHHLQGAIKGMTRALVLEFPSPLTLCEAE